MTSPERYTGYEYHQEPVHEEQDEDNQPQKIQDQETRLWLTLAELVTLEKIRYRVFEHTKVFDPQLLERTGMDEEFLTVFGAIGWEEFWDLTNYPGSRLLTLEFLSTVQTSRENIYFRMLNQEYTMEWEHFSGILWFVNCSVNLEHATRAFHKPKF